MPKKKDNLEVKIDELTADLQRVHADFQNYRRRSEEGRGEILDLAKQDIVLELLPLIDNIDRALGHMPADLQDNDWALGVQKVGRQAQEVLRKMGIEKIASLDELFDPHLHEAVAHEGQGETVIEELQPGYRMGDKIIRHAMVKVGGK